MTEARLEPITPIKASDLKKGKPGPPPRLEWIPIERLRINRAYQRDLSEQSVRLIRRTVENWSWSRVKALSVAPIADYRPAGPGDELYEVRDGQHTAIAALTRGDIRELPCLVGEAGSIEESAAAFVGLNTDRVGLTSLQIFWGRVVAGETDPVLVAKGVHDAGGRIPRSQPGATNTHRPGDVIAVKRLEAVAAKQGDAGVARIVKLGIACGLAPVQQEFIFACGELMWGAHAGVVDDKTIERIVVGQTLARLLSDARVLREEHGHTLGRGLGLVIVRMAGGQPLDETIVSDRIAPSPAYRRGSNAVPPVTVPPPPVRPPLEREANKPVERDLVTVPPPPVQRPAPKAAPDVVFSEAVDLATETASNAWPDQLAEDEDELPRALRISIAVALIEFGLDEEAVKDELDVASFALPQREEMPPRTGNVAHAALEKLRAAYG